MGSYTGWDHVRELVIVCLPAFSYGEFSQIFLRSTKRRTLLYGVTPPSAVLGQYVFKPR